MSLKTMSALKRCNLHISSYVGISPGASHYYGSLHYYNNKGEYKDIKLKHRLTAEEAKLLSGQDFTYEKGEWSERFNSEDEIRELALKEWKKRFPDSVILLEGSSSCASVQHCLGGPRELKAKINVLFKEAEKIDWYEKDEDLMTKIDDDYMNLLKAWENK